ncbi:MAG: protein kinase [Deltaproteobacteria bacterium]|nr:protein kinase [Deltaproteobacteria bacterium]MBK8714297.1 protein kinase [Deltaproteobacteria bacterium]MBP7285915.1 protein kinase [Nannocystaceae bacterium]
MTSCAQCRAPVPAGARNCPRCGITLSGAELETQPGTGVHAGAPHSDVMIGRSVIDQYVVRAKLGEGGMGAVYLADQPTIGRQAVIKVIHPWLSRDASVASRFATEAKAAARLQNPHIVSIYNYGRMPDGTLFLAMEHLNGRTLAQALRAEGRLDPTRAVGIATQVCEALSHAHARGVVHRDLKPSNIMLVARDRGPEFVKVLDFGIAKLDGGEGTAAGVMLGTPQYMSPEQLTGKAVDGRSDLYALGLVLYEMLTGHPPFRADSAIAYIHKHTSEAPLPLAQARPGLRVPPALEACLLRALAKSPHQRPQTADVLADELWSALMATVDSSHVPMPRTRAPAPPKALVVLAVAGGIGVLGGIATAGWFALQSREAPRGAAASPPDTAAAPAVTAPPAVVAAPPVEPAPSAKDRQRAALRARPITELEAELQRATVLSGLPIDRIEQALREYQAAVANPPPGVDATEYRKALLADLIVTWRELAERDAGLTAIPRDRPLLELEAVFLTMASSYGVEDRHRMLLQLKNATAGEPNADALVYTTLLQWIDAYGEADEPIEIINDDDDE